MTNLTCLDLRKNTSLTATLTQLPADWHNNFVIIFSLSLFLRITTELLVTGLMYSVHMRKKNCSVISVLAVTECFLSVHELVC